MNVYCSERRREGHIAWLLCRCKGNLLQQLVFFYMACECECECEGLISGWSHQPSPHQHQYQHQWCMLFAVSYCIVLFCLLVV